MEKNMPLELRKSTPEKIDAAYINALTNLINACRKNDVHINGVSHLHNGWIVTFEGLNGDAICHDGSYGSSCYLADLYREKHKNDWGDNSSEWETMGFPWDYEGVSVHDSEELAEMIGKLQKNKMEE